MNITTASFHIIKHCNTSCKFCYATFTDLIPSSQLNLVECITILNKLYKAGIKKITFAGGEPMLFKNLDLVIVIAKEIGFTTSIITNGSFLTHDFLIKMQQHLDWIGISVDSLDNRTNLKTGRLSKVKDHLDYYQMIYMIKQFKYKIKINTVVNRYNQDESLQSFINYVNPQRWKIFDTLRVDGQNHKQFDEIKSTKYNQFIDRHSHPNMVVENNKLMTGSYLLIDSQGRLFENSKGKHSYSNSLLTNTFDECYKQINVNEEMFIKRGGEYEW